MAYTSGYFVVFARRARRRVGGRARRRVVAACAPRPGRVRACAAIAGGIAILPLFFPYRRVAIEQGMVQDARRASAGYSATLNGYLASAGRLHTSCGARPLFEQPIDAFFPGVIALLLALAAVVWVFAGGS